MELGPPVRLVEIEHDAALAAVQGVEAQALQSRRLRGIERRLAAGRATARRLDLDHVGAEAGEDQRPERAARVGQVEDAIGAEHTSFSFLTLACMQRSARDVQRRAMSDPPTVRRSDPISTATLLFAIVLAAYTANGRTIWSWDTLAARYMPFGILRHGSFYLDDFPILYENRPEWRGAVRQVGGHWVSSYPVGAPLVAAPFYIPAVLSGLPSDFGRAYTREKVSAATIVALSVALLYLALLGLTTRSAAMLLALAYAFGTSSFSVSSQALWQHGPSQLALAAALLLLARGRAGSDHWVALAGFPLAMAVVCRPSNLFLAAPLWIYAAASWPRRIPWLLVSALPPVIFQLWYNTTYLGDPLWTQFPMSNARDWQPASWPRVASSLYSPSRGLFVYSPIFLSRWWGSPAPGERAAIRCCGRSRSASC